MNFFNLIPAELIVFAVGASPISELRGAIPLALGVYNFSAGKALLISFLGNLLPAIILLWALGPVSGYLIRKSPLAEKFFTWLFARTRHKFTGNYERLGELALLVFVAIPFPITGVWTGSVAAFLFGIPKRRALVLISGGALVAGLIVTLASLGVLQLF